MKLLADENFPLRVVHSIRRDGHNIVSVGSDLPGTSDVAVLEFAEQEGRVLLTLDRDFWQLSMQRAVALSVAASCWFASIPLPRQTSSG